MVFLCGVAAGMCFCITHPIESVKTRVQVMTVIDKSRGFINTAYHILSTEGEPTLVCVLNIKVRV